jgi:predicted RNA binding protein YcfA (HicA-like mRNA interferase family)
MPNLPIISAQKLIRVLKKKGFILQRIHGSHHIFIEPNKHLMVVVPVHKGKDLGKGITRAILKDADMTIEEFLKLL